MISFARGAIAIPARLESMRLPNKLLLARTGRPLLAHVVERCLAAAARSGGQLTEVFVACDDERLCRAAEAAGVRAALTGRHHQCGTTRIAEAVGRLPHAPDFVVNVQGDEPELAPEAILAVVAALAAGTAPMATLAVAMPAGTAAEKADPNVVKVALAADGHALCFSRAPIPYDRQLEAAGGSPWHHHLGIYAYRTDFLQAFAALPPTPLEQREGLEQLRALEHGHRLRVAEVPAAWAAKGIDTAEDYEAFVRRTLARSAAA